MPESDTERIPYREEERKEELGQVVYFPRRAEKCPDCGVEKHEKHLKGCDVEQCPECGMQLISCDHAERYLDTETDE